MRQIPLVLAISGGGSTAEAILRAWSKGKLPGIKPALVIASKPGIQGINRAISAGVKTEDVVVISRKAYAWDQTFGDDILWECVKRGIKKGEAIWGQYGWLPKTPWGVINHFRFTVNQHNGPIDPGRPGFGGKGMHGEATHWAVLEFRRRTGMANPWTEATAQLVDEEYDKGQLWGTSQVPVFEEDTPEILAARVLPKEHLLQIAVLDFLSREENQSPHMRREPLIRPEHINVLEEVKREAAERFSAIHK